LTRRRQRVRINSKLSEWQSVLSGIPQGSIFEPLLFIIFINDIVDHCDNGSEIFLYAADAKIFRFIQSNKDQQLLQGGLNNVKLWSD
jgi:hypothetical protein